MSDTARKLFDGLSAMRQGLQRNLLEGLGQVKDEAKGMGTQGSMEFTSGIFNGQGYVPYGPGQYTPTQEHQQQHERGIER